MPLPPPRSLSEPSFYTVTKVLYAFATLGIIEWKIGGIGDLVRYVPRHQETK